MAGRFLLRLLARRDIGEHAQPTDIVPAASKRAALDAMAHTVEPSLRRYLASRAPRMP